MLLIETLRQYENEGWLTSQVHPSLPLIIWNYTKQTQYKNHWDEITLNCRALVTDQEGEVVSKGFPKFFNYSEGRTDIPENIEWVRIYEKLDGSYIGLFWYENRWVVNSRGSFTSDQVGWAKEILKDKDLGVLNKTWTYCFELIHPENRIVVDYGVKKDLIFLKAFHTESNTEVDLYKIYGFSYVDSWLEASFKPYLLKELNNPNEEGFVVQFSNGERCKIKFEEYIKLHSICTRTSTYDIWRCLKEDNNIGKIVEEAPDEIFDWIDKVVEDLRIEYFKLQAKILGRYIKIMYISTDKEFAEEVKWNKYKHFLFALRNNKDITKSLWDKVKPEWKTIFSGI